MQEKEVIKKQEQYHTVLTIIFSHSYATSSELGDSSPSNQSNLQFLSTSFNTRSSGELLRSETSIDGIQTLVTNFVHLTLSCKTRSQGGIILASSF